MKGFRKEVFFYFHNKSNDITSIFMIFNILASQNKQNYMRLKFKFILFVLFPTIIHSLSAKENKHQIGTFLDYSAIHGKPAGFVGLGLGTSYQLNFLKYFSWKNELVFNHGFRIRYNAVEYGNADVMINYVKQDPISTKNLILSSYLKGNVFNKNNNTLSLGLGITSRINFDKSYFYHGRIDSMTTGTNEIVSYYKEKDSKTYLGWGIITNISYSYKIKENLFINSEFGWRGYIGEINKINYYDRASGSSMVYLNIGCSFIIDKK